MPQEANLLYQQACSAEYKEDYNTAIQKLTEALNIAPNDVMIYTKLAGVYSEMGEFEKALEAYQKVSELKPADGYIYVSVGSIYENQGEYKKALDAYLKVMEMCPEYLYNYLNIANVQYQLGDYKAAIENYNKFLSTYSQHRELGGAPLPELAFPVSIFAEQPYQPETDEDTQKRFVDTKPLCNESVPSPTIAQIDAYCQKAAYR